MGIMSLEEYPTKELLESQGRRASVFVRFDESQYWDDYAHRGFYNEDYDNYLTAPVRTSQEGAIRDSATLLNDLEIATGLLKGFVSKSLPASKVFDPEKVGRFLAALEILDAKDGFWWGNQRFYYNPISATLEPMGSDLMSEFLAWPWPDRNPGYFLYSMRNEQVRRILEDPLVRAFFIKELHLLAQQVADGSLESFLKPLDEKYLAVLHRDIPLLRPFDFGNMKRRAAHLSTATVENLDYFNSLDERGHALILHAQVIKRAESARLDLTNVIPAPLEVLNISWRMEPGSPSMPLQSLTPIRYPLALSPNGPKGLARPVSTSIAFVYPQEMTDESVVEVVARIKGTGLTYVSRSTNSFDSLKQVPIPSNALQELLDDRVYMSRLDESTLLIAAGRHVVSETISTPPGYELRIAAGTTLLFGPEASLIVRGALTLLGTASEAIVLEGQPTTEGEFGRWPGIVVLKARQPSLWRNVHIRNTTGIAHGGWKLTGGVTLYESPVRLENVSFDGSQAEDAINIIHSEFEFEEVAIADTVSDGFDADFSNGSIIRGIFQNIGSAGGGDAIDISGSVVSVFGTRFLSISDKALSVGEGSRMTVTDMRIDEALTGAASKDASHLEISSSKISNTRIAGMMAYIKKPEYGPATINAVDVQFSGLATDHLVQTGSEIRIDGMVLPSAPLDVDGLYDSYMSRTPR